jgi:hypothetical protein
MKKMLAWQPEYALGKHDVQIADAAARQPFSCYPLNLTLGIAILLVLQLDLHAGSLHIVGDFLVDEELLVLAIVRSGEPIWRREDEGFKALDFGIS